MFFLVTSFHGLFGQIWLFHAFLLLETIGSLTKLDKKKNIETSRATVRARGTVYQLLVYLIFFCNIFFQNSAGTDTFEQC